MSVNSKYLGDAVGPVCVDVVPPAADPGEPGGGDGAARARHHLRDRRKGRGHTQTTFTPP